MRFGKFAKMMGPIAAMAVMGAMAGCNGEIRINDEEGVPLSELDTSGEAPTEFLLMGMRLIEGIYLTRYEALAGKPLSQSGLNDLSDMGMVETDGRFLRATKDGRMVLNAVIGRLLEA